MNKYLQTFIRTNHDRSSQNTVVIGTIANFIIVPAAMNNDQFLSLQTLACFNSAP